MCEAEIFIYIQKEKLLHTVNINMTPCKYKWFNVVWTKSQNKAWTNDYSCHFMATGFKL